MRPPKAVLVLLAALLPFGTLLRCSEEDARPSCDEWSLRANDIRDEAIQAATLTCSRDEDCALDSYALDCVDDCGRRVLLGRADVSAIEAATNTANQTSCKQFAERGCVVLPNPCVLPPDAIPVCRSGQCDVELQD